VLQSYRSFENDGLLSLFLLPKGKGEWAGIDPGNSYKEAEL